jgi:hypothetical protein
MFKQAILCTASLLVAATAFAGNDFEKVRGITDGSLYTLMADEGAAGKRGDRAATKADDRFEQQRRITDGYNG